MEIRVNKEQNELRQKEEVQKVIDKAIINAEKGVDKFYHTKSNGIGLSALELIKLVEERTNGTVYSGYRGIDGDTITFRISD